MDVIVRDCEERDLPAVLEIYNDAVVSTTAIWNETLVDLDNRRQWLKDRVSRGFPVLIAASADGAVLGYASYGDWRAFDGYKHTVEHSVYVHQNARRGGVASALMKSADRARPRSGQTCDGRRHRGEE